MKAILLSVLIAGFVRGCLAQVPGPWAEAPTNQLSIQLWIPAKTGVFTNVFHAPGRIVIDGFVNLRWPRPHAGDAARVEFFANGKRLGSAKAIWHDEIRPHAPPGHFRLEWRSWSFVSLFESWSDRAEACCVWQ